MTQREPQSVNPLPTLLAIEHACFDFWQFRPATLLLQEVLGVSESTADHIALGMHPLSFEAVARLCAHAGVSTDSVSASAGIAPAVDEVGSAELRFLSQLRTTSGKQRDQVAALLYLPRYLASLGKDDGIRAFARAYASLTRNTRDRALLKNPFTPGTRDYYLAIALTAALPGFAHESRQSLGELRERVFASIEQWWSSEHDSTALEGLIECSLHHMSQQHPVVSRRRRRA